MLTPEEIVNKLKPIMGDTAHELWDLYTASDEEGRKIITYTLENLYLDCIGDPIQPEIVLPPPTNFKELYGEFPIGLIYYADKPMYPFGLSGTDLTQHIGVFGRTGAGKSYFVRGLLQQLSKGKPFLVFDWKGTYTDLYQKNANLFIPGSTSFPFHFNPLILDGIKEEHRTTYIRQIVELLLDCYFENLKLLTVQGVEYLLIKSIDTLRKNNRPLTFKEIHRWLVAYKGKHRENEWKTSALNLLYKVITGSIGRVLENESCDIEGLIAQRTFFELNTIGDAKDKSFFIRSLLLRLYYHFQEQGKTHQLRFFIVIEEAHNILLRKTSGAETIIELMLRQIREYGVGICIVDQHPSLISFPALGTFCTVAFNIRLQEDREAMASALSLEKPDYLGKLPPQFAIVKIQDRYLKPFLIKTFHVSNVIQPCDEQPSLLQMTSIKQPEVIRDVRNDEEVIRGCSEVVRDDNDVIRVIRQASNRQGKALFWEEIFLVHIYTYPLMGAVERYRQLGLNSYQGNKHKTSLVEKKLISLEDARTSLGRNKLMVPTRKGFEWLYARGFESKSDKEGGMLHRYWKRRLRERFRTIGYATMLEKQIGGNRAIDLLVSDGLKKVSIEVETGNNGIEQVEKNIVKGQEYADAVVVFLLRDRHKEKLQQHAVPDSVSIVSTEQECINAVQQVLGDALC
jgi:hypothetical protein